MQKKLIASTVLIIAGAGMTSNVYAKAEWAARFGVGCESCHTSSNGTDNNVKGSAQSAYNSGGLNGLKTYLAGNNGGGTPVTPNTKPVISPIAMEWDVDAGEKLTIPLSVSDAEQDDFQIKIGGKIVGAVLSSEYTDSNGLPTVGFEWTPTALQANKVYKVVFKAKEIKAKGKTSSPVTAKIRVWPAGDKDQASVSKLIVSKTKWTDGKLELKGKVVLNKILTATEKAEFLNRNDLSINLTQGKLGTGAVISQSLPFTTMDAAGNWTVTGIDLAATPAFSCDLTADFEGKKASRKIAGAPKDCIK